MPPYPLVSVLVLAFLRHGCCQDFPVALGRWPRYEMNCYESNANACQIHIVELTDMSCLFLFLLFMYFIQDDGTSHTEDEKFQGLVNFLGYLWMGEDHGLQEVSNTGESEDWFMRLARLLTNLMSSAQQIPIRVLQTVRETNKIVLIVHGGLIQAHVIFLFFFFLP